MRVKLYIGIFMILDGRKYCLLKNRVVSCVMEMESYIIGTLISPLHLMYVDIVKVQVKNYQQLLQEIPIQHTCI